MDARPLIAHVVFRFDTGGLENGIVNLINHMPPSAYRHVVVALTEVNPAFAQRIQRADVQFVSLHKPAGHGHQLYPRFWRCMRELRPALVHTRNLAALEMQVPAAFAGVAARVHGEHGRDVSDLDGSNKRHQWARRIYSPFVHHYVALSRDLAIYLQNTVGIAPARITQLYNGVDLQSFFPPATSSGVAEGCPFASPAHCVIGTVGRMVEVKNQTLLARAFIAVLAQRPELRARLRLVMVGDGPLRGQVQAMLAEAGLADLAWLPGERRDVPQIMRSLNCFVLPSLAEGISNTILEAMATGLPVLATDVGGNADLVRHGHTGLIVPSNNVQAMAACLLRLADEPETSAAWGAAGRVDALARFSMQAMVGQYQGLYDRLLKRKSAQATAPGSPQ